MESSKLEAKSLKGVFVSPSPSLSLFPETKHPRAKMAVLSERAGFGKRNRGGEREAEREKERKVCARRDSAEEEDGYLCNIPFVLSSEHPLMYTTLATVTKTLSLSRTERERRGNSHRLCQPTTAKIVIVQFATSKAYPGVECEGTTFGHQLRVSCTDSLLFTSRNSIVHGARNRKYRPPPILRHSSPIIRRFFDARGTSRSFCRSLASKTDRERVPPIAAVERRQD